MNKIEIRKLKKWLIVPLKKDREIWVSSTTPPWAMASIFSRAEFKNFKIKLKNRNEILKKINEELTSLSPVEDAMVDAQQMNKIGSLFEEKLNSIEEDINFDEEAPIIKMVNTLLTEASSREASDIHFEPYEKDSVVRLRIDGVLIDIAKPPRGLYAALVSRIKIMAQLDIAEKRLPQDGRISIRLKDHLLDVRVSTLPTGSGERVVLRLLDKRNLGFSLNDLGMSLSVKKEYELCLEKPNGIILVTGPTGSGKTTTLYASLAKLNAEDSNIMTVEDPIEYEIPGISQTQVQSKIGLDFSHALRAILRQDPDVIMIGEIRDLETAKIAVQASLTGHLVLATLHTNDSTSAIIRLIDMGIEPYLISSTLNAVLAQRLVRKKCKFCELKKTNKFKCNICDNSGFKGRTGLYEFFQVNDKLREIIKESSDINYLRKKAIEYGMKTLLDDGKRLINLGITSNQEIARVTTLIEEIS